MFWEQVSDNSEVFQCCRMITNNFTLSSGSKPPHGRSRFNLNPLAVNYENCASPDKENLQNSPLRNDDLSFYGGSSPAGTPPPCAMSPCIDMDIGSPQVSPSKFTIVRQALRTRQPLEDHDANSFDSDSGYGASFGREAKKFRFAEPAPRRIMHETSPINKSSGLKIFHSLSSGSVESMDDGFMELFEMDSMDENAQLPSNLNSLISGDIKATKTPDFSRPNFRRSLSSNGENLTPASSRVRNCLFKPSTPDLFTNTAIDVSPTVEASRCFKRPKPPSELVSPVQIKRRKSVSLHCIESPKAIPRPVLQRSYSENEASIKLALARANEEPGLIGDFSKPFCLPLTEGRHQDLKSISCDTLASLIRGNYDETVGSYKVIDCRYPYEFEGGHITGAKNFYTKDLIIKELVQIKTDTPQVQSEEPKRNILVFHCEFSSERGPKLSRFLRNFDRDNNKESYPALHYPEVYLLHGGYKDFFQSYADLCDPVAYRPMLDPKYDADLRLFRAKSKSWNGDMKATNTARFSKSRSRLNL